MADAEGGEPERPSFTSFWKRVKQKEKDHEGDGQKKHRKGKKAEELQDDVEGGGAGGSAEQDGSPDRNLDQDHGESLVFSFALFAIPFFGEMPRCVPPLACPLAQFLRPWLRVVPGLASWMIPQLCFQLRPVAARLRRGALGKWPEGDVHRAYRGRRGTDLRSPGVRRDATVG